MVQTVWTKTGMKCLDTLEVGAQYTGDPTPSGVSTMIINTQHDSGNNILDGVGNIMISGATYPINSGQYYLLWQTSSFFPSNGFSALSMAYRSQPWLSTSAFGSSSTTTGILGATGTNTQKFGEPLVFQMWIYGQGTLGSSSWPNQRYAQGVCQYSYMNNGNNAIRSGRMTFQLPFTAALRQIKFYYNNGNIRGKLKAWSFTNNS